MVVPAYNEAESLPQLHRELVAGLDRLGMPWEIIYVDDGSRDGSERVYEQLCAGDPRVRAILLRRNFGKSAALATGFRAVRGEFVATLDADLQDDPAELPRLLEALEGLGMSWEIVYVDDGSRDGTDEAIARAASGDSRVRGAILRRNFGKSAALATGFSIARGEWVATIDSDLQDDPAELPKLVAALESGFDMVSGWKQNRQDPVTKTVPSRLFNAVTSAVSGIRLHDFNCGFKLYRREVTEALEVYGEFHRFLPALAHWRGFRVGEGPVKHRPRRYGKSKFGASRFINGFLDLMSAAFISTSALKPLHVFGRIGLAFLLVGAAIGVWFVVLWANGAPIRVRPLMMFGMGLAVVGVQLILMGLLGEMIAHHGARRSYPARRRFNLDGV